MMSRDPIEKIGSLRTDHLRTPSRYVADSLRLGDLFALIKNLPMYPYLELATDRPVARPQAPLFRKLHRQSQT